MKTISVKIPDSLSTKVSALAKAREGTKSEIIREALEDFCQENGRKTASLSCLEVAKDLAGSVSGPRDLSHNPKHMKGYGQ